MPHGRHGAGCETLRDRQKVVVFGGYENELVVDIYDLLTGTWTTSSKKL